MKTTNHNMIRTCIRWLGLGIFLFSCAYKFKRIIDNANGKKENDSLPPNPNDKVEKTDDTPVDPEEDDDSDFPFASGAPTQITNPNQTKSAISGSTSSTSQTGNN